MPAGEDVTDIDWEPPETGTGPGEVTIEHRVIDDVNAPMTEDDARRLADLMFGVDKTEVERTGEGVHWIRRDAPPGGRR